MRIDQSNFIQAANIRTVRVDESTANLQRNTHSGPVQAYSGNEQDVNENNRFYQMQQALTSTDTSKRVFKIQQDGDENLDVAFNKLTDDTLSALDKDGDGRISRDEAKGTILEKIFSNTDNSTDKNGYLTGAEILAAYKALDACDDGNFEYGKGFDGEINAKSRFGFVYRKLNGKTISSSTQLSQEANDRLNNFIQNYKSEAAQSRSVHENNRFYAMQTALKNCKGQNTFKIQQPDDPNLEIALNRLTSDTLSVLDTDNDGKISSGEAKGTIFENILKTLRKSTLSASEILATYQALDQIDANGENGTITLNNQLNKILNQGNASSGEYDVLRERFDACKDSAYTSRANYEEKIRNSCKGGLNTDLASRLLQSKDANGQQDSTIAAYADCISKYSAGIYKGDINETMQSLYNYVKTSRDQELKTILETNFSEYIDTEQEAPEISEEEKEDIKYVTSDEAVLIMQAGFQGFGEAILNRAVDRKVDDKALVSMIKMAYNSLDNEDLMAKFVERFPNILKNEATALDVKKAVQAYKTYSCSNHGVSPDGNSIFYDWTNSPSSYHRNHNLAQIPMGSDFGNAYSQNPNAWVKLVDLNGEKYYIMNNIIYGSDGNEIGNLPKFNDFQEKYDSDVIGLGFEGIDNISSLMQNMSDIYDDTDTYPDEDYEKALDVCTNALKELAQKAQSLSGLRINKINEQIAKLGLRNIHSLDDLTSMGANKFNNADNIKELNHIYNIINNELK